MLRSTLLVLCCAACAAPPRTAQAPRAAQPFALDLEAGSLWQTRNDVRIPGEGGTRFSMRDLIGDGTWPVQRLTADWDLDTHHALRAVVAPLEIEGTGTLPQAVDFAGGSFAAGVPTRGTYRFSSYRLGYRYTFHRDDAWRLRVGGTLFVRDAKVELVQGTTRASDSNVGVVPLLNLAAEYTPPGRWAVVAELDGLAAPQGRAVDFSLRGRYDLDHGCSIGLGYRTIEGGADNDEVFNFAWLHTVFVSFGVRF